MSFDPPERALRRWFDAFWNARRLELAEELIAPHAIFHDASAAGGALHGPAGIRAHAETLLQAIPNLRFTIEQVVGSGDGAAARVVVTGNLTGPGLGVEPANQPLHIRGLTLCRFRDGLVVEAWNDYDLLGSLHRSDVQRRPRLPVAEE